MRLVPPLRKPSVESGSPSVTLSTGGHGFLVQIINRSAFGASLRGLCCFAGSSISDELPELLRIYPNLPADTNDRNHSLPC